MKTLLFTLMFLIVGATAHAHCGGCASDKAKEAKKSCCGSCGGAEKKAEKACPSEKAACPSEKAACPSEKACDGEKACESEKKAKKSCCGSCGGKKETAAKAEIPMPKMACCPAES